MADCSCYYAIMAPPLSPELRWPVVYWYIELEWNADECARISQRSRSSIFRVIRCFLENGTVLSPRFSTGRPQILSTKDRNYILALLQARPSLYLDEIQLALYTHQEVNVSLSTISRALVAAAYSRKSISWEALERNEALRAAWQAQWGIYDASAFLWVDECGIDDRSSQRLFGYAPIGHHCVERSFFYHDVKYLALPVLGVEGILGISIFEGAVTKERFLHFLRTQVAPLLNPFSPKGVSRCILVCDNCAIHHDEEIRQLVEDECALMLGAKLCYLPPYSPDFNPIEEAFSKAKSWLRRHNTQLIEPAQHPWLIHQAMLSITPDNALGWIENCGYSI
ncbi:transposase domain-containing protein [Rhizoctonia solani AG-1 IA]|uniref:Transposase domain-containing protein n=1 Tax=Thanatephorus cucumeris (strain AG1-IA) TaxID=983506 RepID=L8WXV8_THACA|nr:transposase domain-containing protein [Rhizoctonia solani AG-1 IA]